MDLQSFIVSLHSFMEKRQTNETGNICLLQGRNWWGGGSGAATRGEVEGAAKWAEKLIL
jgi:hypothetical protein